MKKNLLLLAILLPFFFTSCGDDKDEPSGENNGGINKEYVDLGLTSGTLWATCNIGASSPYDYGSYFAWGETTPKDVYSWDNYKWCNGSNETLTKYCTVSYYGYNGFKDDKTELDPEDDAATANWGSKWRMPSQMQFDELRAECTWEWYGNGYFLTSKKNGKNLILPAAGYMYGRSLDEERHLGTYWTRMFNPGYTRGAYNLCLEDDEIFMNYGRERCYGRSVRAIRVH